MSFTTVNGITLHYTLDGALDAPCVILLHPLGTDRRIWGAVSAQLGEHLRIICCDLRGHGLSDAPPGPYTVDDLAADIAGLLDVLQIDSAIWVGVSVGGLVAMQAAITFPDRVKALVLCDTAPKIGSADFWDARAQSVREQSMAAMADTILTRWFAPEFAERDPASYRGCYHWLTRTPLEGYLATCAALRDADLRPFVGAITVPVLVLAGEYDVVTTPDAVRALANQLPNARFGLIEGAGHTPAIEQPEALAAALLAFFEEQGDVGR